MSEQWTMRPSWDDAPDDEDWSVRRNGTDIGRIFRQRLTGGRQVYAWFLNKLFPINFNEQGSEDTLDAAKAAFRRSWERSVQQHGIEKVEAALSPQSWHAYLGARGGHAA